MAGPLKSVPALDTRALHLAPVAGEAPGRWEGRADFVGLTPQGLLRRWERPGAVMVLGPPPQVPGRGLAAAEVRALAGGCDAIVLSEHERRSWAARLRRPARPGRRSPVTDGPRPNTLLVRGGAASRSPLPAVGRRGGEDLGAGDVFAAAFFVSLSAGRAPGTGRRGFANAAAAVRMLGRRPTRSARWS